VIVAENLGVHIAGRRLLRNVAAAVAPGEFVAIIGPNGAGKSTLLRALSGELRATEGRVSLDGVPIERVPRIELARRRAVLPQAVRLAFPMLAEEVVALGRTPHFGTDLMRDDKVAVAAAIGWAGVGHLCSRVYDTLSGGEQQRVNLARVFAQISIRTPDGPRYLLLDEPTAPLDVAQQHHVLRLIRALADNGVGVCAVLHDLNQAALWADRIIAIRDGEGAATGTPEDVITEQTLEAVYAMPFEVLFSRQGQPLAQVRAPMRPAADRPTLQ
jgi:iron complex transport system ATP-binding protein